MPRRNKGLLLSPAAYHRDGAKIGGDSGTIIVAVSAPTALAVRMADAAGMTLVAIARKDGFEVFPHPHRVKGSLTSHVA